MKVAYLLGTLNQGGTETLLLDVFNSSEESPFGIIGIYRKDGILSERFHSSGVRIVKLEPGSPAFVLLYLWRLRKLLKLEKVDIVHAQQSIDMVYASIATLGLKVKVVNTFHGFDFNLSHFSKSLIWLSLKMGDKNIFVSKTQLKYYLSSYKLRQHSKQIVVYNGVNFEKLKNDTKTSIRSELGINQKELLISMVGNFIPGRDHLSICRFLDLLNRKGIDFTFLFIGKKYDRNPILFNECRSFCQNNGLKDNVFFLGSRSDVPLILPQLDAFVYSSTHDTFGIAIIEAIACGIPVFVNDWDVMKEITEEGRRVTLYRTKSENDLLDKFLSFLTQPEKYKKAALDNASWVRKTYSIQKHLERLYEVYCGIN